MNVLRVNVEQMRTGLAGFLSVMAAAAAPTLIVIAMFLLDPGVTFRRGNYSGFVVVFVVALVHPMVLGLPAALVLVHRKAFRAVPMLVAGACVGMLPVALLLLAIGGGRDWVSFFEILAAASGLGAAGSLAFFVTHRLVSPRGAFPAMQGKG